MVCLQADILMMAEFISAQSCRTVSQLTAHAYVITIMKQHNRSASGRQSA
jgi:hypothetical protein